MDTPFAAEFLGQLLRSTGQASLLALVVWLVIHALGEHLNAEWRCRLWLLAIVRLAWPVSLPSPVSLFNLFVHPTGWSSPGDSAWHLADALDEQVSGLLERPEAALVWSLGAGVLLLRALLGAGWAFWLRASARPMASWDCWWLLQECKGIADVTEPVAILESSRIKSPCLLGMLRPALILPAGLAAELSRNELRLVLLHELAHMRRRDLALNWVLAAVETIHWFNPVVWVLTREIRDGREEACDARALASQPQACREYGRILLKLLSREPSGGTAPVVMSVAFLGRVKDELSPLRHRLNAIMRFRPGNRTWVVGFCTWLALALVGLTDPEPRAVPEIGNVPAAEERPLFRAMV